MTVSLSEFTRRMRQYQEGYLMCTEIDGSTPTHQRLLVERIPGAGGCCDFCSRNSSGAGWSYKTDFDNGWWACEPCAEVIEGGYTQALAERCLGVATEMFGDLSKTDFGLVRSLLYLQQGVFWGGMTGERQREGLT